MYHKINNSESIIQYDNINFSDKKLLQFAQKYIMQSEYAKFLLTSN